MNGAHLNDGAQLNHGATVSSGPGWRVGVGVETAEFLGDLEGSVVGGKVLFGFCVSTEAKERVDGEDLL